MFANEEKSDAVGYEATDKGEEDSPPAEDGATDDLEWLTADDREEGLNGLGDNKDDGAEKMKVRDGILKVSDP